MLTDDHLALNGQRPAEATLSDAELALVPRPAARAQPGWQRRVLTAGITLAGVVGCAYGASRLLAKPSPQPETAVHGDLDAAEKFALFTLSGEEPAIITWKKHPSKCWSVPEKVQDAAKLNATNCTDKPDKFIIPAGSTGTIRPASHPGFCLDAPAGSTIVQLWKCEGDPPKNVQRAKNMQWLLPGKREGHIRPANNEEMCADVPSGKTLLQQWHCSKQAAKNEGFVISLPDDCKWEDWAEWTSCKDKCKDTFKTRNRTTAKDGGAECEATKQQKSACGDANCSAAGAGCQPSRALVLGLWLLCSFGLLARR